MLKHKIDQELPSTFPHPTFHHPKIVGGCKDAALLPLTFEH